ncbi:MAG: flagellar basal body P-ring protein FlgI [Planctomycetota bacterium]|jgi:hypothetical protein
MMLSPRRNVGKTLFGCIALMSVAACSGIERTQPGPRSSRASRDIAVPQILRGTVASEGVLQGFRPVVVHGHGLVVGLDGTGASDVPPDVRAHMVATAARHGIGSERSGWGNLSPEALLDSPDTAVVVVEGVIPPGSPAGTRFDVRVVAFPTSSTESLEGGRLYTAELVPRVRPSRIPQMLPLTGSRQPAALAQAGGPVFINPFVEPKDTERDTVNRRTGRILNGGVVVRDMPLKLRLITPSHTRASILQSAINTRFPQEPGQPDPTARGESDESIEITVPPSFHDRTETFVELLRHTTIRQVGVEAVAVTIRRHLLENPATARAASWRWQALGPRALPTVRDLYDTPEELPRLAALRAGANLNDPLVGPHLIDMAESGSADSRRQAIDLLAEMGLNPLIDRALRALLNDQDVEIRLAAYEALAQRRDPAIRRTAVDDKFVLDVVESDKPMVYITQIGLPVVAAFGRDLSINLPVTVSAWSRRFMIKGDLADERIEVYYRPPDATQGAVHRVTPDLATIVEFLGRSTSVERPEPGLGFSYSEVVGVLHQIWRQGYLDADFKAEQDRILAAIIRQEGQETMTERPEFTEGDLGPPEPPTSDEPESPSVSELDRLVPALPSPEPRPPAPGPPAAPR